jgi:glycosyltransferase involved in cell wall biosynthesis
MDKPNNQTAAPAPEISVIVPCHNEEKNLRPLVAAVRAVLDPLSFPYEMVFIDDGSTDRSWESLQALQAGDTRIRALRFERNCGQSAALWAGFQGSRGEILVTLDADLQNDPRDIPRLLEALKTSDCVCGSRVQARHEGDSFIKIASSRIANWVRNKLSQEEIADAGCCYRAFRRKCLKSIKGFRGFHRFLPTLIRMEGFRVAEIPVGHKPRLAGVSHYGIWNRLFTSFVDLLAVRWMKKRKILYEIADRVN